MKLQAKPPPKPVVVEENIPVNFGHDRARNVRESDPDGAVVEHLHVTTQTMLDRYFTGGHIDQRQYDAGNRLRNDMLRGQMIARVSIDPTAIGGASFGAPTISDSAEDARRRVRKAIDGLYYKFMALLTAVVLDDCSASSYVSREGLGRKASASVGLDRLRTALNWVADHYEGKAH